MGKRLLVVDSDRRFIQDHKSQLESAFEVDFLYTTDGALTRLEAGDFGAVLLCVETSENKGYALCSAIRRAPMFADLKIALISAKASEEEYARHRATKGKADLYLHKPMNATALIPALAALVPMKEDDPDNPLGDLAGADLGDEWLESLRTELETDAPAPRVVPPIPVVWAPEPVLPEKPARNQGEIELLEWRVKDLETKLLAQHDELEKKGQEIEELKAQNAAVTRNLDEAQLSGGQGQERLQAELKAAQDEHRRMEDQLEEVNTLLTEKNQQNAELMETHQLLQAQLEEAWEAGDRIKVLERSLAEAGETLAARDAHAAEVEQQKTDLLTELEAVRADAAVKQARVQELEGSAGRASELETQLNELREQASFQEITLRNLAEERARLQGEKAQQEEALGGRARELQAAREERDALTGLRDQLERACGDLQSRLEASEAAGLERETALGTLRADLEAVREQLEQLDRAKADLTAQLLGRDERFENLSAVLAELEGKARQALDLARA